MTNVHINSNVKCYTKSGTCKKHNATNHVVDATPTQTKLPRVIKRLNTGIAFGALLLGAVASWLEIVQAL